MTVRHVAQSVEFECDLCRRTFVCLPQLIERWAAEGKSPRVGAEFWDIELRLHNPTSVRDARPETSNQPALVDGDVCGACVRKILGLVQ